MNAPQKTLAREGRISGKGLHTGKPCSLALKPLPAGSGLCFSKEGRPIEGAAQESQRCSAIGQGADQVLTVEHLLAALRGCGITDLSIDVEGPEVPAMDGSALPFVKLFKELGVVEHGSAAEVYRVSEPIFCYDKQKAIAIFPGEWFRVSYLLDYDHPELRGQKVEFVLSAGSFEREIAPARTFCTEREAAAVRESGLGQGADKTNTVVVAEDGSHRAGLRFPDECARHKVLDILGDLNTLGFAVAGRVIAIRSGHALNRRLAEAIRRQREAGKFE